MVAPLVTYTDAELVVVGYLRTLLPDLIPATYKVGTKVPPGVTPVRYIRVRLVGGDDLQRVAGRPRVDVQVWSDGSDDVESMTIARALHAEMRRRFGAATFALPVQLAERSEELV